MVLFPMPLKPFHIENVNEFHPGTKEDPNHHSKEPSNYEIPPHEEGGKSKGQTHVRDEERIEARVPRQEALRHSNSNANLANLKLDREQEFLQWRDIKKTSTTFTLDLANNS
jgi:hypothetical protein